jgi:hypothetical protein
MTLNSSRADFTASAALLGNRSSRLQLHALRLASAASSAPEKSRIKKIAPFGVRLLVLAILKSST